ncbi:MAG: NAD(+)/NADH kinase, partial [bacterium]|nr:NAD(+)/NADH kinase [bacterium]
GGDGTLLAAIRSAYPNNIPVWGINVGDLGYLTISSVDEIGKCIKLLAKGEYWVEPRAMIEAVISDRNGQQKSLIAFNDIVVHRQVPGGNLIVLNVQLDGHFLGAYEADGLIFATPTGSTAYNLSAGGSILSPNVAAFIITPICAHSFSARSLVIDDSRILVVNPMIKMPGDVILVTADGQEIASLENCRFHGDQTDKKGCEVVIRKADQSTGLIRFEDIFFFDVLRDKLGWAEGHLNHRNQ